MKDYESIKLVLIGASNTGKTTFVKYLTQKYETLNFKDYQASVCATFFQKKIIYNGNIYQLDIWDTVGDERYTALAKIFFIDALMIFIFYNSQEKQTFERAKFFVEYSKRECINKDCIYALICNKYDINLKPNNYENIISDEEVIEFVEKNNLLFAHLSISEKYSNGVNELLKKVLEHYIKKKNK